MGKYAVNVHIGEKSVLIPKNTKIVIVRALKNENDVRSVTWISFRPWMKESIFQWQDNYAIYASDIEKSDSKGAMILLNDLCREKGKTWFHEHISGEYDP